MIFVTGPSGVGKSFLAQSYHSRKGISPLLSVNTRPLRPQEKEKNRTISRSEFLSRQNQGELCLISENHGNFYAYVIEEIKKAGPSVMIEVDSGTAISEQQSFEARIVRVHPSEEKQDVSMETLLNKRDNIDIRLAKYWEENDPEFLAQRGQAGDFLFTNNYDDESLERFIELIDKITSV